MCTHIHLHSILGGRRGGEGRWLSYNVNQLKQIKILLKQYLSFITITLNKKGYSSKYNPPHLPSGGDSAQP